MDRFGLFVDAGYLYGEGGKLVAGTPYRDALEMDFGQVTSDLVDLCAEHCNLPHLRTYWYDGGRDGSPSPLHISLAHEKRVKIRLGQLIGGRQKGVDSRIVRDLIMLSHKGAMASAYLLGGDEDLREGVEAAQEWGIPVTLIGIKPSEGHNLSKRLVRAVDEVLVLDQEQIENFLDRLVPLEDGEEFGRTYGSDWRARATEEEIREIRDSYPRIPSNIDGGLLSGAEDELGPAVSGDEPLRRAVRRGFWDGVEG